MKCFLLLIGLLLFNPIDAKQKYYKWTDADGNTHYSETKPLNKQTDEIKVNTHQPTIISHNNEQESEPDEKSPEEKEIDEYNKNEHARVMTAQNKANCAVAKKNLKTLQDTLRVKRKDPTTGEYIRMDDTQRIEMMKKSTQSIKDLCG